MEEIVEAPTAVVDAQGASPDFFQRQLVAFVGSVDCSPVQLLLLLFPRELHLMLSDQSFPLHSQTVNVLRACPGLDKGLPLQGKTSRLMHFVSLSQSGLTGVRDSLREITDLARLTM